MNKFIKKFIICINIAKAFIIKALQKNRILSGCLWYFLVFLVRDFSVASNRIVFSSYSVLLFALFQYRYMGDLNMIYFKLWFNLILFFTFSCWLLKGNQRLFDLLSEVYGSHVLKKEFGNPFPTMSLFFKQGFGKTGLIPLVAIVGADQFLAQFEAYSQVHQYNHFSIYGNLDGYTPIAPKISLLQTSLELFSGRTEYEHELEKLREANAELDKKNAVLEKIILDGIKKP